jgi:hypothetical protein
MMGDIKSAIRDSDIEVLKKAPKSLLPKGKNFADILALEEKEKRPIIAKARAYLTRQALAHTKGVELMLPEETGLAVSQLVDNLRKQARAIVKSAKKDEATYNQALKEVDLAGVSSLQVAMVRAAKNADREASDELEETEEIEETPVELPANVLPLFATDEDEDDEIDSPINLPSLS